MRLREVAVGLLNAALLHEIESEIRVEGRLRVPQRQGAPQMPLARGQVIHLGEEQAECVVAAGVVRIGADTGTRDLLGVGQTTMSQ